MEERFLAFRFSPYLLVRRLLLLLLTSSRNEKLPTHPLPPQAGVIATVRTAVTLDRDDPAREAAVAAVRQATNTWVAKYRRDNQFSGKPSYG